MDSDRVYEIICKRLCPLKSKEKVRAVVDDVLAVDAKQYEAALRLIALQSDAAMDGRDAGSWAKLVATNALIP